MPAKFGVLDRYLAEVSTRCYSSQTVSRQTSKNDISHSLSLCVVIFWRISTQINRARFGKRKFVSKDNIDDILLAFAQNFSFVHRQLQLALCNSRLTVFMLTFI